MAQVSALISSEYRHACTLLYDELLFGPKAGAGAEDGYKDGDLPPPLPPIEAWKVKDDLDLDEPGGSWLTDRRNAELLQGTESALLRRIRESPALTALYVRDSALAAPWAGSPPATGPGSGSSGSSSRGSGPAKTLCPKAIALYESRVQEFLRRLAVLVHIPAGPPVRAPELFSVTTWNTARRRHLFIWQKLVMVHIQYHKSQEVWGGYRDNIRFLPRAIGDLLLTYLAYVVPLRQTFLRQARPGALLSPRLWARLDGAAWRDEMLSRCLGEACIRASIPRFSGAWWRQVAASITKEKFTSSERANLAAQEGGRARGVAEPADNEVEDEAELVSLAEMSNHSFRTFNHAYAGSTTLTRSTLLHRAYRASQSWRDLFGIDGLLPLRQGGGGGGGGGGKRPWASLAEEEAAAAAGGEAPWTGMLEACKRARFHTRAAYTEASLLVIARRLYNDPALQFRAPGQRRAILAIFGQHLSEQVVIVLATGSGKTLPILLGTAVEDAGVTVLILPTVALRYDMLGRLRRAGI
jgi:hypothetical protein